MTGVACIALDVAIAVGGSLFAIVALYLSHIAAGNANQAFLTYFMAARAAPVTLLSDRTWLTMPGDLGFHNQPAQIVLAGLVLLHLFLMAFTAGLGCRHFRLGPVIHGVVLCPMAVVAANFILFYFCIGMGTAQVLRYYSRCHIDMAPQAILMGHLILIQGLFHGGICCGSKTSLTNRQQDTGCCGNQ